LAETLPPGIIGSHIHPEVLRLLGGQVDLDGIVACVYCVGLEKALGYFALIFVLDFHGNDKDQSVEAAQTRLEQGKQLLLFKLLGGDTACKLYKYVVVLSPELLPLAILGARALWIKNVLQRVIIAVSFANACSFYFLPLCQ